MDTRLQALNRATALDPYFYTEAKVYDFEMTHILREGWQVVAPADLVSGTGDVIARTIGNVPIVIVRSAKGRLNGFYNICPHRAGPLATCDRQGTKRLRCGYHGWAYDHDGQLKSAPEMGDAEGFEIEDIHLTSIDVVEWQGLVFARAPKEIGNVSFSNLISGIDEIVSQDLSQMQHHMHLTYDVAANWKVYVDNYLEGYHLPFVHPDLTQVVNYPDYKTDLSKWWSLQRSPVESETEAYEAGEALYFFIYPNTMLNILPGRMQTNRVVPTGIETCKVEFDFYYAPGAEKRAKEDFKFSDQVQEEDRSICEHVQKGLTSGVYRPGRLSPAREAGVWHWQNLLREQYAQIAE